jgi:tetratricopeptide (TPR) repeat protein
MNRGNEAMQYVNKVLEIHPNISYTLILKGYLFYILKKYDKAKEYIDKGFL